MNVRSSLFPILVPILVAMLFAGPLESRGGEAPALSPPDATPSAPAATGELAPVAPVAEFVASQVSPSELYESALLRFHNLATRSDDFKGAVESNIADALQILQAYRTKSAKPAAAATLPFLPRSSSAQDNGATSPNASNETDALPFEPSASDGETDARKMPMENQESPASGEAPSRRLSPPTGIPAQEHRESVLDKVDQLLALATEIKTELKAAPTQATRAAAPDREISPTQTVGLPQTADEESFDPGISGIH